LANRLGLGDVLATDLDRDGHVDLVLTEMFNGRSKALRNDGTGHFTDVTSIVMPQASFGAASAAVADFDGDGDLDVYLVDMHSDMWVQDGMSFDGIDPSVRYK